MEVVIAQVHFLIAPQHFAAICDALIAADVQYVSCKNASVPGLLMGRYVPMFFFHIVCLFKEDNLNNFICQVYF